MRTVRFLLTASIFSCLFIGMVVVSAAITGAVHAQLSARSLSFVQN